MSGSGLLVFLPLLAAIVSTLIGAYANGWYRDRQDKKAREREREGLLRIIDPELYENIRLLRGIEKNADLAKYPSQSHVSTDAWNQSRARVAGADESGKNLLSILANRALAAGETARNRGEKYIGSLPDYHAADEGPSTTE
jgi:hypothetical protein